MWYSFVGSSSLSQAVFETSNQNFQQSDLLQFQTNYGLTKQAADVIGTTASTSCTFSTCYEGSLDIQYIMGVAQNISSIFWYSSGTTSGDSFLDFVTTVASTAKPPSTLSISWGGIESQYPNSYLDSFQTEAMKLTAMGTTIFASSGDDGVAGYNCRCTIDSSFNTTAKSNTWSGSNSWSGTGYFPDYPASCPYVVAVGATSGPESGNPEVVCEVCNHYLYIFRSARNIFL